MYCIYPDCDLCCREHCGDNNESEPNITLETIITNLDTGDDFTILPDRIYVLDNHDNHTFEAIIDVVLISILNPPVTGAEIHQADGSYSLPQPMAV